MSSRLLSGLVAEEEEEKEKACPIDRLEKLGEDNDRKLLQKGIFVNSAWTGSLVPSAT
jgi:hypothetical protein